MASGPYRENARDGHASQGIPPSASRRPRWPPRTVLLGATLVTAAALAGLAYGVVTGPVAAARYGRVIALHPAQRWSAIPTTAPTTAPTTFPTTTPTPVPTSQVPAGPATPSPTDRSTVGSADARDPFQILYPAAVSPSPPANGAPTPSPLPGATRPAMPGNPSTTTTPSPTSTPSSRPQRSGSRLLPRTTSSRHSS